MTTAVVNIGHDYAEPIPSGSPDRAGWLRTAHPQIDDAEPVEAPEASSVNGTVAAGVSMNGSGSCRDASQADLPGDAPPIRAVRTR
jgi:hypothetical protein